MTSFDHELQRGRAIALRRLEVLKSQNSVDKRTIQQSKNWIDSQCIAANKYTKIPKTDLEYYGNISKSTGDFCIDQSGELQLFMYASFVDGSHSRNKLSYANLFDTLINISVTHVFYGSSLAIIIAGSLEATAHLSGVDIRKDDLFFTRNLKICLFDDFGYRKLTVAISLSGIASGIQEDFTPPTKTLFDLPDISRYANKEIDECIGTTDILRCSFARTIDTPIFYLDFMDKNSFEQLTDEYKNLFIGGVKYLQTLVDLDEPIFSEFMLVYLFSDSLKKKRWIENLYGKFLSDYQKLVQLLKALPFNNQNEILWSTSIVMAVNACLNMPNGGTSVTYFSDAKIPEKFKIDTNAPIDNLKDFWSNMLVTPPFQFNMWDIPANLPLGSYELYPRYLQSISSGHDPEISEQILSADNVDEVIDTYNKLMLEASSNKTWVIPPKAVCEIQLGPFTELVLTELNDVIYFAFATENRRILHGYVQPHVQEFWMTPQIYFHDGSAEAEKVPHILILVISSFIRDFWVVEERERVFSTKRLKKKNKLKTKGKLENRIVYLPRIKYVGDVSASRISDELELGTRQAHSVSAHLRKSDFASTSQKQLAALYNYEIPQGYTFVRPHSRGELKERNVIFRSKSAINLLLHHTNQSSTHKVDWFQFERDVAELLENLGFHAQHTGRSGDGGVDIIAEKESDLGTETWLVQCKAVRKTIGTPELRDLIGANQIKGGDNKLMMVTTSDFSADAIQLAESFDIKVINGQDFIALKNDAFLH